MSSSTSNRTGFFNILLLLLYIFTFALVFYYINHGWDFYATALSDRPHHEDYQLLKPGSFRSHYFGILGSAMMIILLVYSIRKRTSLFGQAGKMKDWLNFHIYLGITGPIFIILHSTLKLNGIVAVSFWSMIAVALSGVIGRYLYLQIPRTIVGKELSLGDVQKLNEQLTQKLQERFNLQLSDIKYIDYDLSGGTKADQNIAALFFSMIVKDMAIKIKSITHKKRFSRKYGIPRKRTTELLKLAGQKAILEQRIQFWNRIQELFHYWHIFHKPFAVVMYLIMIIHIGVSVWLGYTWLF